MLKNLKSSYFIKLIFINIHERKKLKIIQYNKNLQNILDIKIYNYKIISGKYIIFEAKEKGKEYNSYNDQMIFEGEYLNGKRNGIGKEYKDNYLVFEGFYLNGKRNGKGVEYTYIGNLKYEGEYLNGKRHGKGKIYSYPCDLEFEGEFLNGKKWSGKGYDNKNNVIYNIKEGKGNIKENYFEGEYLNGEKNGKGKEYYSNGVIRFEGEYLKGKRWTGKGYDEQNNLIYELKDGKGFVKDYDENGYLIYEGEYLNGEKNGKGKLYAFRELIYEGGLFNGKRHGKGKDYSEQNLIFDGEYLYGERHGKGKEFNFDGEMTFEGEYFYDSKIKGKEYINKRLEYEGEFLFDKKWNGKGYDENGNVIYELKNGNGKIKEYTKYGTLIYEGDYLNGKNHGKGKEYDIYSKNLIFEGEYLEGKKWNGKGYDKNNVSIEIKNGKGFMKFYYSNGQIKNDCEFLDGEIKGKVKQYDSDGQLLFEGEYLNGLRNGRGEEYNFNGKIIFEGEYLSGWKYTGIETEYNNKGEILDLNYIINGRYKKFPIGNSEIILLAIKYPKSFGILNN